MNELLLFILFIVPGIAYAIWRRIASKNGCRVCHAGPEHFVRLESPFGRAVANRRKVGTLPSGFFACKICDAGVLINKSVYRLSAPVVAIGYLLLIPSLLVIALCGILLGWALYNTKEIGVGVVFAGMGAIGWALAAFMGGLLGWLLVMKKRVLRCSKCGAVISAS